MDFDKHTGENLEQRKETSKRRRSLLDRLDTSKSSSGGSSATISKPRSPNTEVQAADLTEDKKKAIMAVYAHPEMILLRENQKEQFQNEAMRFEIQDNELVKIPDRASLKIWENEMDVYTHLPKEEQALWHEKNLCCMEEDLDAEPVYGDETHGLLEFLDLGVRYSFQIYKGIYTWYAKFLDVEPNPTAMNRWGRFPPGFFVAKGKISHPFYKNKLVPQTHLDFKSCETLATRHWDLQHKECRHGHFRVNIYVNQIRFDNFNPADANDNIALSERYLVTPQGKHTSHRVCGHALVTDLFRAMGGCVDGRTGKEPEDWQCLREVLFNEKGHMAEGVGFQLGKSYQYGLLKSQNASIRMIDTAWFPKGRNFVWLVPTIKNHLGVDLNIEVGDPLEDHVSAIRLN